MYFDKKKLSYQITTFQEIKWNSIWQNINKDNIVKILL